MAKTKLTLWVPEDLIQEIKIRAIIEKTSVSQITEELYREYLGKKARQKR